MLKSFETNVKLLFISLAALFLLGLVYSMLTDFWPAVFLPAGVLLLFYIIPNIELPYHVLLLTVPLSFPMEKILPVRLDFPDELLQLLVTALMAFYFIKKKDIYKASFFSHPFTLFVLASFVWTLLATLGSSDVGFSAKFLIKKIWFLVPFFFFGFGYFYRSRNLGIGFWAMFSVLTLIVLAVMYKAKGVGFNFSDVHDPIQPFFKNHVMYGSMISCFFFAVLGAFWVGRKGSVYRFLLLLSIPLYLIAVYFSYSRGAWGAVLFGIGMMIAIRIRLGRYIIPVIYTLILSLVLWLAHDNRYLQFRPRFDKTVMHENLTDHLMATLQGTDISSAERYHRWIATVRMSQDYPILGVGPNKFYDTYPRYAITEYRTWVSRNIEKSTTHNYFLFMLAEQGWVGMLLYAGLVFFIFWRGQRIYFQCSSARDRRIVLAILGMLAAVFVNNFFSELLETDKIGSLFYIGLAILVAFDLKTRGVRAES